MPDSNGNFKRRIILLFTSLMTVLIDMAFLCLAGLIYWSVDEHFLISNTSFEIQILRIIFGVSIIIPILLYTIKDIINIVKKIIEEFKKK